jgi:hypothetical protein
MLRGIEAGARYGQSFYLRKFFTFLSEEKGITNEKALKGLQ